MCSSIVQCEVASINRSKCHYAYSRLTWKRCCHWWLAICAFMWLSKTYICHKNLEILQFAPALSKAQENPSKFITLFCINFQIFHRIRIEGERYAVCDAMIVMHLELWLRHVYDKRDSYMSIDCVDYEMNAIYTPFKCHKIYTQRPSINAQIFRMTMTAVLLYGDRQASREAQQQ